MIAAFLIIALAATAYYFQIDKLAMVQSAIIQQDANWTAGITSVSHLSTEEKLAMCGARIAPLPPEAVIVSRPITAPADPPTFDWRNVNGSDWTTPIRNQAGCGSCWAFSVMGVAEAAFNIYSDNPNMDLDLSEQHLVSSCCTAGDCKGGWPPWALDCIQEGISNETCFPYIASNSSCIPCEGWEANKYQTLEKIYIRGIKSEIKWALQEYGPLSVLVDNGEDWFFYTGGVYEQVWTSEGFRGVSHAVVLVGWDESRNAWICKNSYGVGWGLDGYGYVHYNNLLHNNYVYGVTGIVPHTPPTPTPTPTPSPSCTPGEWQTVTCPDGIEVAKCICNAAGVWACSEDACEGHETPKTSGSVAVLIAVFVIAGSIIIALIMKRGNK